MSNRAPHVLRRRSPSKMRFVPGHVRRAQQDEADEARSRAVAKALRTTSHWRPRHNWGGGR